MKVTRKILACMLVALMVISSFAGMITVGAQTPDVSSEASGYNGTPDTDFETDGNVIYITSAEELMGFAETTGSTNYSGKIIKLTTDVVINAGDAANWKTTAPTYSWSCSISSNDSLRFNGTFDGQGHTISGLYSKTSNPGGLFGIVNTGATVQNVNVVNSYFEYKLDNSKHCNVGGIVGYVLAGNDGADDTTTIANCHVDAIIYTSATSSGSVGKTGMGGIVGYAGNNEATQGSTLNIFNCSFTGSVEGFRFIGGIVGRLDTDGIANIKNCSVDANIVSNVSGTTDTGAAMIVGNIARHSLNIENCLVEGTLGCTASTAKSGILLGYMDANAADSEKSVSFKNILIAVQPVEKGFSTVLFNTYVRKEISCSVSNIVYDSTLYPGAASATHIDIIKHSSYTGSYNGLKDQETYNTITNFKATAKTTAELKGAAVFNGWTVVEGDYPTPVTSMSVSGVDAYDGTPDTNYLTVGNIIYITSAEELMGFASTSVKGNAGATNYSGKTIILTTDVIINAGDSTSWRTTAPEYAWVCYPMDNLEFAGTFDGQGHVISGIYSYHTSPSTSGKAASGLFGVVSSGATIQNVKVVNSFIGYNNNISTGDTSHSRAGGIVGYIDGYDKEKTTNISNCYVEATLYTKTKLTGSVGNTGIGGIVGYVGNNLPKQANTFNITNCSFKGSITGYRFLGGIVGRADADNIINIKNCQVDADIISNVPGTTDTGAAMILGCQSRISVNIENCLVEGTLGCTDSTAKSGILLGYVDTNAADSEKSVSFKNILIAAKPVEKGIPTVLFTTNVRKVISCSVSNIVYDSTLYPGAASATHISVLKHKDYTGSYNGLKDQATYNTITSFKATAKTTAELTGANGKALFSAWNEVANGYPTPCTMKDVDDYGYAKYGTPVAMLGYQTRANAGGTTDVRLLATVGIGEGETYVAAGFKDVRITLSNGETKLIPVYYCQYAYNSVIGAGETYTADKYLSDRIICLTVANVPADVLSIEATPFVMTSEEAEAECGESISWNIGAVDTSELITVMSVNVYLHDDADPDGTGPKTADDRVNALQAQILTQDPDVICVQEDNWTERLDGLLTSNGYTAARGDAISRSGWENGTYESYEYQTIYFKEEKFELVGNDQKWLSETPDKQYSEFEGNNGPFEGVRPRGVNYAELKIKGSEETFFVFNVHLENYSPTKRMMEAEKLVALVDEIAGDKPSIMCGDFNLDAASKEAKDIAAREYLNTTHDNSSEVADITETYGTYINAGDDDIFGVEGTTATSTSGTVIDYCFTSKDDFYVHSYDVISEKQDGIYTSDHLPLVIKLLLRTVK